MLVTMEKETRLFYVLHGAPSDLMFLIFMSVPQRHGRELDIGQPAMMREFPNGNGA